MPETPSQPPLDAEFDTLMARAGLTIPPERRARYIAAFAEFRTQLKLVNVPRSAAVEPANVFRLSPIEAAR